MRWIRMITAVVAGLVLTLLPGGAIPRAPATAVAAANPVVDFNGDGFADLAIGIPMDRTGSVRGGAVSVLYGTGGGLSAASSQLWSQNSTGIPDTAEDNDLFGQAVATGDFNGDGFTDLAVGVPGESVNTGGGMRTAAGGVHVLYGSIDGLTAAGTQFFTEMTNDIPEKPENNDMFGAVLAAGDFNGDGFADLAVGVPGESRGTVGSAGVVIVLPGSAEGLRAIGSRQWDQKSTNVLDKPEANDRFGSSLAAGDFNGDERADLAIGVPLEDVGAANTGGVHILYGGPAGLSATGNQFWTQGTTGIADGPEAEDQFGVALGAGDFNDDGNSDLAIGVREGIGGLAAAGAVHVLYGTTNGLAAARSQLWTQDSPGITDAVEAGDLFGTALTTGDFSGDALIDLAIGAPGEALGGLAASGAVHILFGTATGLSAAGTQFWTQDGGGILDLSEANDRFGWALGAGDFEADGFNDLVVGVPFEDVGGLADAGAVHVILGGPLGLTATGNQFWNQGTAGVAGDLEAGDLFGTAIAGPR